MLPAPNKNLGALSTELPWYTTSGFYHEKCRQEQGWEIQDRPRNASLGSSRTGSVCLINREGWVEMLLKSRVALPFSSFDQC